MFYENIESLPDRPDPEVLNNYTLLTEWLERKKWELDQRRRQTRTDQQLQTPMSHTETFEFGYPSEDKSITADVKPAEGEIRIIQ